LIVIIPGSQPKEKIIALDPRILLSKSVFCVAGDSTKLSRAYATIAANSRTEVTEKDGGDAKYECSYY
jgi:hypothetical protein